MFRSILRIASLVGDNWTRRAGSSFFHTLDYGTYIRTRALADIKVAFGHNNGNGT